MTFKEGSRQSALAIGIRKSAQTISSCDTSLQTARGIITWLGGAFSRRAESFQKWSARYVKVSLDHPAAHEVCIIECIIELTRVRIEGHLQ